MANGDVSIRPIIRSDLENGFLETLSTLRNVGLSPAEASGVLDKIDLNPNHLILVAEVDYKIVGTATILVEQKFIHRGGRVAHIEDVAVHRDWQGRGIGRQLIEVVLFEALKRGCYKAVLDCSEMTTPFYEKLGFRKHKICMRKPI